ncbi:hypothetical protein [Mesorhizobium sp. M1E.F.Ca.ET.063.01.1.1]|uniref:hypothetical protein n=1 Tax=Mesorhizobium sp. M1E.F.Ca.ET.063.01.1.1 TaxID=2496750 RepID=UPI000FC9EEBC|nr:hypothetical protein [Mesorhizobium sp. M1E.F.Ca.ET.063.01.1.1]RUW84127.1 hypothetical protein EOA29_10610 [Mesorhizobium sp. M1E.F.Ca.ET.063.01.1.1]
MTVQNVVGITASGDGDLIGTNEEDTLIGGALPASSAMRATTTWTAARASTRSTTALKSGRTAST